MHIVAVIYPQHGHPLAEVVFLWITDRKAEIKDFGLIGINDNFANFLQGQSLKLFMVFNNKCNLILNLVFAFFGEPFD